MTDKIIDNSPSAEEIRRASARVENDRIDRITELGNSHTARDLVAQAISRGDTPEDFLQSVLKRNEHEEADRIKEEEEAKAKAEADAMEDEDEDETPKTPKAKGSEGEEVERTNVHNIDTSFVDPTKYSLVRAISQISADKAVGGYEAEVHQEMVSRGAVSRHSGLMIPSEYVGWAARRSAPNTVNRAANVSNSGSLISTDLMPNEFITSLRERTTVSDLGARFLDGLVGDVDIPRQTANTTASWYDGEGAGADPESAYAVGKVSLVHRTLRTKVPVTRKLLSQSTPAIEGLLSSDLLDSFAIALMKGAISGNGTSPNPTGILSTTGIGNKDITSPAAATFADMVSVVEEHAKANFMPNQATTGFLVSSSLWGHLASTPRVAGDSRMIIGEDNTFFGYPVRVYNDFGSGVHLLFGDWSQLLIGLFGAFEIRRDENVDGGGLVLRAYQDADVAVRHPVAFVTTS